MSGLAESRRFKHGCEPRRRRSLGCGAKYGGKKGKRSTKKARKSKKSRKKKIKEVQKSGKRKTCQEDLSYRVYLEV